MTLLRRRGARREGQGAARDPPADRRRGAGDGGARPVHARAWPSGEEVPGYLEEEGVPAGLDAPRPTPRCALEVDNWRWAGVPIYLRTGKRLARKVTEIAVTLKPVPHLAFEQEGSVGVQPNQLVMTMQPNEGVSLSLGAKIPGTPHAHPAGEHGVPLRHGVHVAVARGLRAADHGRHARRRHAVHARRRGGGAVAHHRPDPRGLGRATPRPLPQYAAGSQRPRGGRTRCSSRATAGGRSEASTHGWTTSGARRTPRPARSTAALRELLRQHHATTRPTCRRGCSTWWWSSTASGAARSRTGWRAWAATTPRARSSAPSSRGARTHRRLGHA